MPYPIIIGLFPALWCGVLPAKSKKLRTFVMKLSAHTHTPCLTRLPRPEISQRTVTEHTVEVFRCLPVPSAPRNALVSFWATALWKGNSAGGALCTAELPTDIELQSPPRSRHTHTSCLTQLTRPEISQRSTRSRCCDASQCPQRR